MPRPLRITVPNLPFHIIDRGNNKQTIFYEKDDFIYFLKLIKRYQEELEFKLYHFCLMPNHIHLMMEPTIEDSLPKIMMRLTLAYASYFNQKNKGVGHVWQGRYKSSLIDKEKYFLDCALYIELNPVRARIVKHPQDWPWSSYGLYAFNQTHPLIGKLINPDPYYLEIGNSLDERQARYINNAGNLMQSDKLKTIRQGLAMGVFGEDEFVRTMKEEFSIGSLRKRGRPRKAN